MTVSVRTRRILGAIISIALVVGIFGFAFPKLANFAEVRATIAAMTPIELATLGLVALWNIVTYWFVMVAALPGSTMRQAALVNQSSTAVANTLPGGGAIGIGVTYAMYRSYGFSTDAIAGQVLVSGVWNNFVKFGMPIIALGLLALQGDASTQLLLGALIGIAALIAAIAIFAAALWKEAAAAWIGRTTARIVRPVMRLLRRPAPRAEAWAASATTSRVRLLALLRGQWILLTVATLVSHFSLYLVLLIALRDVGVSEDEVSWIQVLAAFSFSRLVTALPVTPGGLGVLELALAGALIAAGGDPAQVAAGVLLYRAFTYLPPILFGGPAYLIWRREQHRTGSASTSLRGRRPQPYSFSRHPADVVRLLLAGGLLVLTALPVRADSIGVTETNVFRLINDLPMPGWLWPIVWAVMQLGSLMAVPATAALAALTRRWRLAFDLLVAGGTVWLLAKVVKGMVNRGRPDDLLDGVHIYGAAAGGRGYISGHAAVAVALATVASPYLGRRGRRIAWTLAVLVCISRIWVGAHLPLDVLGGAALGWLAGVLVHLVLGAPGGRPSTAPVRRALEHAGLDPIDIQTLGGVDARRSALYRVVTTGPILFVKFVPRERRDHDVWARALRRLIGSSAHELGPPPQQVQHEASIALLARDAGVNVPPVVLVQSIGNGAGLYAQEWIDGRDLSELVADEVNDTVLSQVWEQLVRLRAARIAHADLSSEAFILSDDGQVWLVDFSAARSSSGQRLLDRDVADTLMALSAVAGVSVVVESARASLDEDVLTAAMTVLEASDVGPEARRTLQAQPALVTALRSAWEPDQEGGSSLPASSAASASSFVA
ncbi:MAG TPA: lysylphosphatidylglycerol synthase domain-containing protein [Acidothermales bacterium]